MSATEFFDIGEGRSMRIAVAPDHRRDPEGLQTLGEHRNTDQPAAVDGHEVDSLGRDPLGGHDEIALVLAVLGVDDNHHLTERDRSDGLLHARQPARGRPTGEGPGDRRGDHVALRYESAKSPIASTASVRS